MAKGPDYQMLLKLRNAIIGEKEAKQNSQSTQNEISRLSSRRNSVRQETKKYTKNADELEQAFRAPHVDAATRKAKNKDRTINFLLESLLVVAVLAILGLGGWLIYTVGAWSWNTPIQAMITNPYLGDSPIDYWFAVGIHLFALAALLGGIAGILGYKSQDAIYDNIMVIGAWVSGVLSGISLIVSLCYYYSDCGGVGRFLLYLVGSVMFVPKFFVSLFYCFLFLACVAGVLFGGGFVIYKIFKIEKVETPLSVKVDCEELYDSDEYKKAKELDAEINQKVQQEYALCYQKTIQNYDQRIDVLKDAVKKYNAIASNCAAIIRSTDINPTYKTLENLDILLYYFEYNRADTLKEAVNEFVRDQQFLCLKDQLDKLNQTQQAQLTAINQLSGQLNQMKNSISAEIRSLQNATTAQTAQIEKNHEAMMLQSRQNIEHLMEYDRSKTRSFIQHPDLYI